MSDKFTKKYLFYLLIFFILIRSTGLLTYYWIDEIITTLGALRQDTLMGIYTNLHVDNNHILNSVCTWFLGLQSQWAVYRIFSFISSIILLILLFNDARKKPAAKYSFIAIGAFFLLILLSSENRGYAPMHLFLYLGLKLFFDLLNKDKAELKDILLFNVYCVLGLLSHSTFVNFLPGAAIALIIKKRGIKNSFKMAFSLFSPIFIFSVLHYIYFIKKIRILGGPLFDIWRIFSDLGYGFFGFRQLYEIQSIGILFFALILLTIALTFFRLKRNTPEKAWLFLISSFIFPNFINLVLSPPLHDVRYYSLSCFLILYFLPQTLERKTFFKKENILILTLTGLFFLGNLTDYIGFSRYGRGSVIECMEKIESDTPNNQSVISAVTNTTNDARLYFTYYHSRIKKKFKLQDLRNKPTPEGDWLIMFYQNYMTPNKDNRVTFGSTEYKFFTLCPAFYPTGTPVEIFKRVNED